MGARRVESLALNSAVLHATELTQAKTRISILKFM